jgi:hypothetical protein
MNYVTFRTIEINETYLFKFKKNYEGKLGVF